MAGLREDVYCTLLMSDSYLPGAAVLAHSLRDGGTSRKLAVLVTPETLLPSTLAELKALYDYVIPVDKIANPAIGNLIRLNRLDLRFAFTKIALWRQMQFRKIVYIDADVVALRAPDELFDLDASFAAAADIGWPDCFNSGVMLLTPSMSDYWSLHTMAASGTSFDGADQGLLNEFYANQPWHRLSFAYNCTPSSSYQYEPAFRQYQSRINMVHFIGTDKPWYQGRQAIEKQSSGAYKDLLGKWWAVYDRHYRIPQTSALGQISAEIKSVKQFVRGEQTESAFGWAASGAPPPSFNSSEISSGDLSTPGFSAPGFSAPPPAPPPQLPSYTRKGPPETTPPQISDEPPISLPTPIATTQETPETNDQGNNFPSPPPTAERQRRFSAPKSEWDATRFEPPSTSKPEAQSFPSEHYEMSQETQLFTAPKSYPDPPKDMWYKVPEIKPAIYEKPKPIFPWESLAGGQSRAKPTRIFADDFLPASELQSGAEPQEELPIQQQSDVSSEAPTAIAAFDQPSPRVPAEIAAPAPDPWHSYTRTNAWDDDMSIDRYIRALKKTQTQRGQIQIIHHTADRTPPSETRDFATGSSGTSTPTYGRRESILLTDFPTEIERPSLPVTPAPRRISFWGTEKEGGEPTQQLVPAEGVPEQNDWVCPNCGYACHLPDVTLRAPNASTSDVASTKAGVSSIKARPVISDVGDSLQRPFSPFSLIYHQTHPRAMIEHPSPNVEPERTRSAPAADLLQKNPNERLEELRRSSIVAATEKLATLTTDNTRIPLRQIPESSELDAPLGRSNLEEMFSGARTQERIESAGSDLARGMNLDDEIGTDQVTNAGKGWNAGFGLFDRDEASEEMQEPLGWDSEELGPKQKVATFLTSGESSGEAIGASPFQEVPSGGLSIIDEDLGIAVSRDFSDGESRSTQEQSLALNDIVRETTSEVRDAPEFSIVRGTGVGFVDDDNATVGLQRSTLEAASQSPDLHEATDFASKFSQDSADNVEEQQIVGNVDEAVGFGENMIASTDIEEKTEHIAKEPSGISAIAEGEKGDTEVDTLGQGKDKNEEEDSPNSSHEEIGTKQEEASISREETENNLHGLSTSSPLARESSSDAAYVLSQLDEATGVERALAKPFGVEEESDATFRTVESEEGTRNSLEDFSVPGAFEETEHCELGFLERHETNQQNADEDMQKSAGKNPDLGSELNISGESTLDAIPREVAQTSIESSAPAEGSNAGLGLFHTDEKSDVAQEPLVRDSEVATLERAIPGAFPSEDLAEEQLQEGTQTSDHRKLQTVEPDTQEEVTKETNEKYGDREEESSFEERLTSNSKSSNPAQENTPKLSELPELRRIQETGSEARTGEIQAPREFSDNGGETKGVSGETNEDIQPMPIIIPSRRLVLNEVLAESKSRDDDLPMSTTASEALLEQSTTTRLPLLEIELDASMPPQHTVGEQGQSTMTNRVSIETSTPENESKSVAGEKLSEESASRTEASSSNLTASPPQESISMQDLSQGMITQETSGALATNEELFQERSSTEDASQIKSAATKLSDEQSIETSVPELSPVNASSEQTATVEDLSQGIVSSGRPQGTTEEVMPAGTMIRNTSQEMSVEDIQGMMTSEPTQNSGSYVSGQGNMSEVMLPEMLTSNKLSSSSVAEANEVPRADPKETGLQEGSTDLSHATSSIQDLSQGMMIGNTLPEIVYEAQPEVNRLRAAVPHGTNDGLPSEELPRPNLLPKTSTTREASLAIESGELSPRTVDVISHETKTNDPFTARSTGDAPMPASSVKLITQTDTGDFSTDAMLSDIPTPDGLGDFSTLPLKIDSSSQAIAGEASSRTTAIGITQPGIVDAFAPHETMSDFSTQAMMSEVSPRAFQAPHTTSQITFEDISSPGSKDEISGGPISKLSQEPVAGASQQATTSTISPDEIQGEISQHKSIDEVPHDDSHESSAQKTSREVSQEPIVHSLSHESPSKVPQESSTQISPRNTISNTSNDLTKVVSPQEITSESLDTPSAATAPHETMPDVLEDEMSGIPPQISNESVTKSAFQRSSTGDPSPLEVQSESQQEITTENTPLTAIAPQETMPNVSENQMHKASPEISGEHVTESVILDNLETDLSLHEAKSEFAGEPEVLQESIPETLSETTAGSVSTGKMRPYEVQIVPQEIRSEMSQDSVLRYPPSVEAVKQERSSESPDRTQSGASNEKLSTPSYVQGKAVEASPSEFITNSLSRMPTSDATLENLANQMFQPTSATITSPSGTVVDDSHARSTGGAFLEESVTEALPQASETEVLQDRRAANVPSQISAGGVSQSVVSIPGRTTTNEVLPSGISDSLGMTMSETASEAADQMSEAKVSDHLAQEKLTGIPRETVVADISSRESPAEPVQGTGSGSLSGQVPEISNEGSKVSEEKTEDFLPPPATAPLRMTSDDFLHEQIAQGMASSEFQTPTFDSSRSTITQLIDPTSGDERYGMSTHSSNRNMGEIAQGTASELPRETASESSVGIYETMLPRSIIESSTNTVDDISQGTTGKTPQEALRVVSPETSKIVFGESASEAPQVTTVKSLHGETHKILRRPVSGTSSGIVNEIPKRSETQSSRTKISEITQPYAGKILQGTAESMRGTLGEIVQGKRSASGTHEQVSQGELRDLPQSRSGVSVREDKGNSSQESLDKTIQGQSGKVFQWKSDESNQDDRGQLLSGMVSETVPETQIGESSQVIMVDTSQGSLSTVNPTKSGTTLQRIMSGLPPRKLGESSQGWTGGSFLGRTGSTTGVTYRTVSERSVQERSGDEPLEIGGKAVESAQARTEETSLQRPRQTSEGSQRRTSETSTSKMGKMTEFSRRMIEKLSSGGSSKTSENSHERTSESSQGRTSKVLQGLMGTSEASLGRLSSISKISHGKTGDVLHGKSEYSRGQSRATSEVYQGHLQEKESSNLIEGLSSTLSQGQGSNLYRGSNTNVSQEQSNTIAQGQSSTISQGQRDQSLQKSSEISTSTEAKRRTYNAEVAGDIFNRITAAQWALNVNPIQAKTGSIIEEPSSAPVMQDMRRNVEIAVPYVESQTAPRLEAQAQTTRLPTSQSGTTSSSQSGVVPATQRQSSQVIIQSLRPTTTAWTSQSSTNTEPIPSTANWPLQSSSYSEATPEAIPFVRTWTTSSAQSRITPTSQTWTSPPSTYVETMPAVRTETSQPSRHLETIPSTHNLTSQSSRHTETVPTAQRWPFKKTASAETVPSSQSTYTEIMPSFRSTYIETMPSLQSGTSQSNTRTETTPSLPSWRTAPSPQIETTPSTQTWATSPHSPTQATPTMQPQTPPSSTQAKMVSTTYPTPPPPFLHRTTPTAQIRSTPPSAQNRARLGMHLGMSPTQSIRMAPSYSQNQTSSNPLIQTRPMLTTETWMTSSTHSSTTPITETSQTAWITPDTTAQMTSDTPTHPTTTVQTIQSWTTPTSQNRTIPYTQTTPGRMTPTSHTRISPTTRTEMPPIEQVAHSYATPSSQTQTVSRTQSVGSSRSTPRHFAGETNVSPITDEMRRAMERSTASYAQSQADSVRRSMELAAASHASSQAAADVASRMQTRMASGRTATTRPQRESMPPMPTTMRATSAISRDSTPPMPAAMRASLVGHRDSLPPMPATMRASSASHRQSMPPISTTTRASSAGHREFVPPLPSMPRTIRATSSTHHEAAPPMPTTTRAVTASSRQSMPPMPTTMRATSSTLRRTAPPATTRTAATSLHETTPPMPMARTRATSSQGNTTTPIGIALSEPPQASPPTRSLSTRKLRTTLRDRPLSKRVSGGRKPSMDEYDIA